MFKRLANYFKYKFKSNISPEMIAFKDSKGNLVKDTRVSNMAHLSNKKNISLGENVFIGHFNYLDGYKKVIVGEGCQITNNVSILTHSSHHSIRLHGANYIKDVNNLVGLRDGEVEIGEYSYIGANAVVMPGSKIGKGCVVSAFAYVDGGYPDYSILRGQPARVIGDTRKIDEEFIVNHAEISSKYYLNG